MKFASQTFMCTHKKLTVIQAYLVNATYSIDFLDSHSHLETEQKR